ncbi:MAG: hypothetical protein GAK43_01342 [Stenotrophomonas maltophilia]|nr:MAG: hypothetical protein GAK43_01342 [Stenotrophomonas maltophilia]
MLLAEPGERVHPQPAARAQMRTVGLGLGFIDIDEDFAAALQVALAGFGQRQAPRGAVQQACLELPFQVGNHP